MFGIALPETELTNIDYPPEWVYELREKLVLSPANYTPSSHTLSSHTPQQTSSTSISSPLTAPSNLPNPLINETITPFPGCEHASNLKSDESGLENQQVLDPSLEKNRPLEKNNSKGDREVRFLWNQYPRRLPVLFEGQLRLARWGPERSDHHSLPIAGWTPMIQLEMGYWQPYRPEPVIIPASWVHHRGVWYPVQKGIRGILISLPEFDPERDYHSPLLQNRPAQNNASHGKKCPSSDSDYSLPWVYILCEPSTIYYEVMTTCEWQPILVDQDPIGTTKVNLSSRDKSSTKASQSTICRIG